MKAFLFILILFFPFALGMAGSSPPEVVPGDDVETVYEILGKPHGAVGSTRFRILHYPRGEVYLRGGAVERTNLISEEELEARRARTLERELKRERERRERLEKGRALRDEKLADESFQERPVRDRLAFWNTFRRHYPEVDIAFELEVTRSEAEEEERLRRQEERRRDQLLALQQRVREAEARATRIEDENRRLEEERRHLRQRPRVSHVSPIYVIQPPTAVPPDKKESTPPAAQPRTRPEQREIRGAPPADPTPFERAREYRLERGNIRSEARQSS